MLHWLHCTLYTQLKLPSGLWSCPDLTVPSGWIFHSWLMSKFFTRRYSPLRRLNSSSCRGLRPLAEAFFCPLGQKRAFYAGFAYFRHFLVFSSNLSKSVLDIIGKSNYQEQKRTQCLCCTILWQNVTWFLQYFWISENV